MPVMDRHYSSCRSWTGTTAHGTGAPTLQMHPTFRRLLNSPLKHGLLVIQVTIEKRGTRMRLLIVSNRLPITIAEENGEPSFQESVGGLVSGLSAYLDSLRSSSFTAGAEYVWIGWPGVTVEEAGRAELQDKLYREHNAFPVFMSEEEMENFYHGFCNRIIWPLFHYLPSYAMYDDEYWTHYREVNESFCGAVMQIIRPDDVVWVHDYHLMLLPGLLRRKMPEAAVGFFLHIPFPNYEIFRLLPGRWRSDILEGLLGADLIGFHTHDYTHYFLKCVLRLLGHEQRMRQIMIKDRVIRVDTFPMGINFRKFHGAGGTEGVRNEIEDLKKVLKGFKVIISVDRLDYTKGIINRLKGYETFLEKNPQWREKVVLALVIVPSRVGVEKYQQIKSQIDELVGKINGRFGSIGWTPILYQYKFLPFDSLSALYCLGDIALITPLRDGMNLIAKEYIASRADRTGVLILSEMAGAVRELKESIIINPNKIEEIAEALEKALEMSQEEQIRRNGYMQAILEHHDVVEWAGSFLGALRSIREKQERLRDKHLTSAERKSIAVHFKEARRKLLLLDYDGTLVPFKAHPHMAKPDHETLRLLKILAEDPGCDLVLVSGRDKMTLQSWFGGLNIGLAAEHGVWIREARGEWQLTRWLSAAWKASVLPVVTVYLSRVPGSFIEEKESSLAWHYRTADPELGYLQAKELISDLFNSTSCLDVQILHGSKVVEIRSRGADKGTAALHFISKGVYDFILAAGDDWTDENLMCALPSGVYTIRVGMMDSQARYYVQSHKDVIEILEQLAGSQARG